MLSIATNIPVLLMTAFVLQGHICISNVHAALFHMIKPRRDQGSCHAPKVTIKTPQKYIDSQLLISFCKYIYINLE